MFYTSIAGCLADPDCATPTMDGFAEFELHRHPGDVYKAASLLNAFTPARVPVLSTLAAEFAVFDRLFASHPGPTFPNRLFQLMGTSSGCTETSVWDDEHFLFEGRTVFDVVEEAGHDWRFYYADAPLEMALLEKLAANPKHIHGWKRFLSDAQAGSLPAFSWVNPRWFVNLTTFAQASDQHPDHDVRQGELLMKEVYEALRASPAWNKTALIITYDEHGGFFDHVPPPQTGVPSPGDGRASYPDKGFKFDRLGVRVPCVVVSPWTKKGTVVSAPDAALGEKPTATSEFDLTSIVNTVRHMFSPKKQPAATKGDAGAEDANDDGLAVRPLTKRDAWSGHFENRLFNMLEAPRTDCPETLPNVPEEGGGEEGRGGAAAGAAAAAAERARLARNEGALPVNDLQRDIVGAFRTLNGKMMLERDAEEGGRVLAAPEADAAGVMANQASAGEWVADVARRWLARGGGGRRAVEEEKVEER
jgi:phospholipase C